ncbi:MAG TPA: hypothetical protein VES66_09860 [Terriglobales bacterium]|nr:hypothetical protein [Terriglobales bacterium]
MFEEELKLQKESSYFVPLVMVLVLIAVIVGAIGYWVVPHSLSQPQAAGLVSAYLKGQGPATVHFHVGVLKPSVDEKIRDPHYRLLEKAGILKLGKAKGDTVSVAFAPEGERKLAAIPGVVKTRNSDGSDAYTVPLADRQLAAVSKVTMSGRDVAYVQFTWKWAPNELGNAFDAAGPLAKSFNTWDRSTLIQNYGVAFYHVEPAQASLTFVRGDKGWRLAAE